MLERVVERQQPRISFEFWDKTQCSPIGVREIESRGLPTKEGLSLIEALRKFSLDSSERRSLCYCLDNNSPKTMGRVILRRGVSAYFFVSEREVMVQWGKINPLSQNAKVHGYLNQNSSEIYKGLRRSGHLSLAHFNGNSFYLAKVDSLSSQSHGGSAFLVGGNLVVVDSGFPEYELARSFLGNGIALLSSDGYPVLTPFYNRELFKIKRGIGVS